MSQTSINASGQPIAVAGQMSDNGPKDTVSRMNGESTNTLGFGLGVKAGTKEHECVRPTASNSVVQGVVGFDFSHSPGTFGDIDPSAAVPGLKPKAQFNLVRKGRVWVQVDADATITAGVTRPYCRFETDGASNTLVGTFRDTDDSHVIDVRKQAVFVSGVRTAADGSKIAELEVDFTNAP